MHLHEPRGWTQGQRQERQKWQNGMDTACRYAVSAVPAVVGESHRLTSDSRGALTMPRRAEEAGIGACGHCGRFGPCLKEASYPEPLCAECFDALEEEGIPYLARC